MQNDKLYVIIILKYFFNGLYLNNILGDIMGYLYKLIDKKGFEDSKKGIISLSHPIFEFKGSEGKFINFAKRIYDKYKKNGLNIEPSETDLKEIKEWCSIYKKTYSEKLGEFNDSDIKSESMIIFCGIMQCFCGYFTTENLDDEQTRKNYISKSELKDKIAYIKIDENILNHSHWRSKNVDGEYEQFCGFPDDYHDYNGFLHLLTITYSEKYNDYNELLKIYNNDKLRYSSTWFDILPQKYSWQKEKRLLFSLRSFEPNSSRTGCETVYKSKKQVSSWEEVVYGKIVDAIHYCINGPRFIYLRLNVDDIKCYDLSSGNVI